VEFGVRGIGLRISGAESYYLAVSMSQCRAHRSSPSSKSLFRVSGVMVCVHVHEAEMAI
jgi:hypothetical protein